MLTFNIIDYLYFYRLNFKQILIKRSLVGRGSQNEYFSSLASNEHVSNKLKFLKYEILVRVLTKQKPFSPVRGSGIKASFLFRGNRPSVDQKNPPLHCAA